MVSDRTFLIKLMDGSQRTVDAYHYETRGDFVDFLANDDSGGTITALRMRANDIDTVELQPQN